MPKPKTEACEPNPETHNVVVVRGIGCTKDGARLGIIAKLLAQAKSERKTKCEELECDGLEDGECLTTIDDTDLQRLEGQINYFPIRRKGCPRNVGWLARLVARPPKFKSICICVPDDEGECC
jgi:hypothetical protein